MAQNRNANAYKGKATQCVSTHATIADAPDPAKNACRIIYLSAGGTGGVPCLAVSNGTAWKQVAIGADAI